MTASVVHLPATATLAEAAEVMRAEQIGDVLVTKDGQLLGVVTDRDIVVRGIAVGADPGQMPLADVVSRDLVTVIQDATIERAIELMRQHALRRLIVTDSNGMLAGIVSIGDLAADLDPESVLGKISSAPAND